MTITQWQITSKEIKLHTANSRKVTTLNNTAVHDEAMMREATADTQDGVSAGGHMINAVKYADDKAVVSNSQQGLQKLMNNVNKVTKEFGIKINVKKTKVMCISHHHTEKERR